MTRRLLRLIPTYRALEAELHTCADARISAESDTRLWKARHDAIEQDRNQAVAENALNLKKLANFLALYSGNPVAPFPEAAIALPAKEVSEDDSQRQQPRKLPRELEREARHKSRELAMARKRELMEALDDIAGGQTQ